MDDFNKTQLRRYAEWVKERLEEGRKEIDTEQALLNKMQRLVGRVPVGTRDLLRILTHPDMIDLTEEYIRNKRLVDADGHDTS